MIRGQVVSVASSQQLKESKALSILHKKDAVVFYLPGPVKKMEEVATKAHAFTCETASILSTLANMSSAPILFVITQSAHESSSPTALAHYALYGFARVAASEYPEAWGGLIDNEGPAFPLLPVRYVKEHSVVRVQDGVPRVNRLRLFRK
jgi:6-methylsalicylic acid synthase